jgi:hypothetical protein
MSTVAGIVPITVYWGFALFTIGGVRILRRL